MGKQAALRSSIIKKQIMALTGLSLCAFLLLHLAGNCFIYLGPGAFNSYAHALTSNPLIYVAEAGLALIFLVHIGLAIRLSIENYQARPVKYYMKVPTGRGANFASSTMLYTGVITLIFIITHLIHFKFGLQYVTFHDGEQMRDLYRLVMEYFSNPLPVAWYIFAVCCLGLHVGHGFWSAFQSLGLEHSEHNHLIKRASRLFGAIVALGYTALPIFCYTRGGGVE